MISIGEFSFATGMSIKTLRYYDEIGLLPAAETDPYNGYRKYSAKQLNDAALLRVLRAGGMSIAQMKQTLSHPEEIDRVVLDRKAELKVQRAVEDWALSEAFQWARPLESAAVLTRNVGAQHWVGVRTTIDLRDAQDKDDSATLESIINDLEEDLRVLLDVLFAQAIRVDEPIAPWLSLESLANRPSVLQVTSCIELAEPLDLPLDIENIVVVDGCLPARIEAFVRQTLPPEDASLENGLERYLVGGPLPQRSALSLSVFAEEAGAGLNSLRQCAPDQEDEMLIEHAITIREL